MSQLPIDLDTESVQFDGNWYTRDELARRIKTMLDSGDFQVARPSQALEELTSTLTSLRTLAFRATPDMADALNAAAARQGKTVGSLIRDAVADHLGISSTGAGGGHAPNTTPPGKRPTDPEMPAVAAPPAPAPAPAAVAAPPIPKAPMPPGLSPAPAAGPGALRAATYTPISNPTTNPKQEIPSVVVDKSAIVTEDAGPEDAAGAVDLTSKKKEEEAIERRWFGG
jgi:hypothetical protein